MGTQEFSPPSPLKKEKRIKFKIITEITWLMLMVIKCGEYGQNAIIRGIWIMHQVSSESSGCIINIYVFWDPFYAY